MQTVQQNVSVLCVNQTSIQQNNRIRTVERGNTQPVVLMFPRPAVSP